MANTVVFLWLSATIAPLPSPSAPGASDLEDFGESRGINFVPPAVSRPSGLPANDQGLVLALEAELEQARTAFSALEASQASQRLGLIEANLSAHPYLPEATFLMAECLALEAQVAREHDPGRALWLEARRQALEGPRAPAFGDRAPRPAASVMQPREVAGLAAPDELEIDGMRLASAERRVELAEGLHHARVFRHGRQIFARFFEVQGESALTLAVPALLPCSSEDFEGIAPHRPPPHGIACPKWAIVQPGEHGGIDIALCERSLCGTFTHWQRRPPLPFAPIAAERVRMPTWAGFVLAGATAVVASGLVLWQAGAFEQGHPAATRWEYGGLNPQALRF